MFTKLAQVVMRSRLQAGIMALLFSLLPFVTVLASVIVALRTLRNGAVDGLSVLVWLALPGIALFLTRGEYAALIQQFLLSGVLVWGLAAVLGHTGRWADVLKVAAGLGVVAVVVAYRVVPGIESYWLHLYQATFTHLKSLGATVEPAALQTVLPQMAVLGTGLRIFVLLLSALFAVGLGRWMQSMLYNPGGLRRELYGLRLDSVAVVGLALIVGCRFAGFTFATSTLCVAILPFIVAGLCHVHRRLSAAPHAAVCLIVFYVVFVLVSPYVIMGLVLLAIADIYLRGKQDGSYSTRENT